MEHNNKKWAVIMPIILALMFILGMFLGKRLDFGTQKNNLFVYPQPDKLSLVLEYVEDEYVDTVDKYQLVEKTIPKLLSNLDPHTVYLPAKEFQRSNEPLQGKFDGIGVQFNIINDTVYVVSPISGGPSEKVGILAGDRIITVNDSTIAGIGLNTNDIMSLLKGKRGTEVNLGIKRRSVDDLLNFTVTRDKIPLYSVDVAYMIDNETGYIKISKFSLSTYEEFVKAIKELKMSKDFNSLVLDLRSNTGGYMDAAINIADEFLETNKTIVYTEGRSRPKSVSVSSSRDLCRDLRVAILIDEWSASASEILAGAIQDNDRGTIIGRRSFGKGLVQEQTHFHDGSGLRLTVARYFTPSGRCIQKPYENTDYYHDLNDRYAHGEFVEKDSIKFEDSLEYKTISGRIVYGGGGIMPDVFVPIDTSGWSNILSKIVSRNLIYNFALKYSDENRQKLSTFVDYKELVKYLKAEDIMSVFLNDLVGKKLINEVSDSIKSSEIISQRLNAYISRNIFDDQGFYPILNESDKTINEAVNILKSETYLEFAINNK